MIRRVPGLLATVFVLIIASSDRVISVSMDEVVAPVRQLPTCQSIEGEEPPVSLQAGMFFHYDTEKREASLKPVAKRYESFQCGRRTATIYLYEYRDEPLALSALAEATVLIWGGRQPSSHHPEAILTVKNVLVVVSSRKPKELVDAILGSSETKKHD